ncbi:MAG: tRNA pseudouridine(55) synthase TruB, partial [Chloroflexi bacterium]|nr:tRNA pseudouridine(55) synthase TruB [Chloroflexota bacterium]
PSALLVHHLPFRVDGPEAERIRHGSAVPLAAQLAHYPVAAKVQALDADGRLIAVGEVVPLEDARPGFRPSRVLV